MSTAIHRTSCPLCGSENQIVKLGIAIDHLVSQEHFELWDCHQCTLRFTQDIPSIQEIDRYYCSEQYISHTDTHQGLINRIYHIVRRVSLRTKFHWVQQDSAKIQGNILDIGCGTGAFLNMMRKQGWQVTGVETNAGAREKARLLYRLDILPEDALEKLQPQNFDVITLWHVLEHLYDLHGTFHQINRLLNKKGTLFIAVPNYTSADSKIYRENWAAYDVPRHLYHFSPASMQYLAELHGFSIRLLHPMVYDAFYVSLLSEKYLNRSLGILRAFWTGLKSGLSATADNNLSSSLVYVLTKKRKNYTAS
ncbi:MAG TPA: class I SAM-dependent methyltransferase [Chitinophagaceae bacterium]|nr:class I SAM-dependent methyltransferase [Chitinophagaceae bacterium]